MARDAIGRIRSAVPDQQAATHWSTRILDLLFEANDRCLELMALMATAPPSRPVPQLIEDLHDVWLNIDAQAIVCAARCPVLLLDIRDWNSAEGRPAFFRRARAVALLRTTLTLAWHVCRTAPHAAGVLLGLPPGSRDAIARLRLGDLEHLARSRTHCLRPRWENQPQMWTELLMAARGDGDRALEEFKLRALQEQIGELLPDQVPSWPSGFRRSRV